MKRHILLTVAVLAVAVLPFTSLADAKESVAAFSINGDTFLAGQEVVHSAGVTDDLFMAGESLQSLSDIDGSLHAAGRVIRVQGAVGRDVYAAGMDISLSGAVGGDATLTGYELLIDNTLGGDLRASGSKVTVNGPVAGYALLAGGELVLNSAIAGDVSLVAENISFGAGAKIAGQLILYEETPGELKIPDSVITEDRITRKSEQDFEDDHFTDEAGEDIEVFSWRSALLAFFSGVILVAAVAALIAGAAPRHLASMRKTILLRPFRTLGLGFVTQAAVIGSAVLFALTVIGLFFVPASVLLAFILGFLGYVIGAYAFGVGLLLVLKWGEPETFLQRALAAALGALVVALLGLIPFLGWLFVLAIILSGIGAMFTRMFRPVFFTEQQG